MRRSSPARLPDDLAAPRRFEGMASWTFTAFLVLFAAGFGTFRTGGVMRPGNELSVERAIFTTLNALTLTGFQQTIGPEQMRPAGHLALFVLTICGTLLTLIGGGTAVARILRLPFGDRQIIAGAIITTGLATLVGGALLMNSRGPLDGLMSAASAFGNSGLVIGSIPTLTDSMTWTVVFPLVVTGGIGLTVLMEVYTFFISHRPLSGHACIAIGMTAGMFTIGTLLFAWFDVDPWSTATLARSAALSLNARSAGLPITAIGATSVAGRWILASFMLLGACSAGTGGGIKLTTVHELFRGTRRCLAGEAAGRATGIAACFVAAYISILLAGIGALASASPQLDSENVFTLATSAMTNVGLSRDAVSITGPGLYVLSAMMIGGRLLPLAVLWWMAMTTRDADVAIG